MNFIIQAALTFFLIQFMVVLTIMVVALLIAQPEVPLLGLGSGRGALSRSFTFVVVLPGRVLRSAARLAHLVHTQLTLPAYHFWQVVEGLARAVIRSMDQHGDVKA